MTTTTHRIRWTAATALHLTLIAAVGYGTHQAVPATAGAIWRWVLVIGITLTVSLAADRLLGRLYGRPKSIPTGPEFAAAHGNDSSTWTPVDFETEQNLAEIDAYLANRAQQPAPATASTGRITATANYTPPTASLPNPNAA